MNTPESSIMCAAGFRSGQAPRHASRRRSVASPTETRATGVTARAKLRPTILKSSDRCDDLRRAHGPAESHDLVLPPSKRHLDAGARQIRIILHGTPAHGPSVAANLKAEPSEQPPRATQGE